MMAEEIVPTPAKELGIAHFRQIFHLPLSLRAPKDGAELKEQIERVCRDLEQNTASRWERSDDPLQRTANSEVYRETAYFHDFVRDFLYPDPKGSPGKKGNGRHSYRRADLEGTEINFTVSGAPAAFQIVSLTMDLFDFGVAMLSMELEFTGRELRLDRAQTLIDHLRRAFPGFWYGDKPDSVPGLCPSSVTMQVSGKSETMRAGSQVDQIAFLATTRAIRIFAWWREILAPLRLEGEEAPKGAPEWRHVLDERVPVMTYLSLTDPGEHESVTLRRISDGDWMRLAAADEAGTSLLPYNKSFLEPLNGQYFYDRFMADAFTTTATRHCFAGYAYAMIGAGSFFDTHARSHFSSHYRQMNFIAHLEFAALLTFSRRLTDLVRGHNPPERQVFRKRLQEIRRDFLEYTHQFLFTDVSNHLQAREMNAKLRASIGLSDLRRDVEAELNAASDFAHAEEQTELAKSQVKLTDFATLFLPSTLGAGFVGMNLLVEGAGGGLDIGQHLGRAFGWMAVAYLVGAGCYVLVTGNSRDSEKLGEANLFSKLSGGAITCAFVSLGAFMAHWGT